MNFLSVSAIIPAFNEGKTVGAIVRVLSLAPSVNEVIVVDDGSSDNTAREARRNKAEVLSLPENAGKGNAMIRGVAMAKNPVILFVDADVVGLRQEHVNQLLNPVISGSHDMVIGVVDRGKALNDINRFVEAPFSGIRALKKDLWDAIPQELKSGYLVDSAISVVADKNDLRVLKITLDGMKNSPKPQKRGFFRGVIAWMTMWAEIGFKSFLFFKIR